MTGIVQKYMYFYFLFFIFVSSFFWDYFWASLFFFSDLILYLSFINRCSATFLLILLHRITDSDQLKAKKIKTKEIKEAKKVG